jgi:hypothetical protein
MMPEPVQYELLLEGMYAQPELPLGLEPLPPPRRDTSLAAVGRTVVLKIADTLVRIPNPTYVEELEERLKDLQREVIKINAGLRRVVENQKSYQRDLDSVDRRLNQKLDRFD